VTDAYCATRAIADSARAGVACWFCRRALVLAGDDEDFDNTAWLIPPRPQETKVAFVGSETEKDPAESLYYLKRAFQQTRRQSIDVSPLPVASLSSTGLPSETRLLVVSGAFADGATSTMQQFLTNGGTVLFLMKNAEAARISGPVGWRRESDGDGISGAGYSMLGQIDFEHPLFAPFADPRFSDFTKIHFWKHRRIEAGHAPGARVVARFDNRRSGDPGSHGRPGPFAGADLGLASGRQSTGLVLEVRSVPLFNP